jgi:hypothetical protein
VEQPKSALMELVEAAVEAAQAQLARYGQIDPTFFIMTEHRLRVVITPFTNEFEKTCAYTTIRQLIAETGAWGYVMVSEAWMSSDPTVKPQDAEDRRDVLVISARTISGETYVATADIPDAKPRQAGELKALEGELDGDAINFFSPHMRIM